MAGKRKVKGRKVRSRRKPIARKPIDLGPAGQAPTKAQQVLGVVSARLEQARALLASVEALATRVGRGPAPTANASGQHPSNGSGVISGIADVLDDIDRCHVEIAGHLEQISQEV